MGKHEKVIILYILSRVFKKKEEEENTYKLLPP